MAAYYNEFDPYAAQWLRNLINAGHIAQGEVDERSIVDVRPDDLVGFTQCHFFAGIGGWSLALRLAGWPDDRPVWTGSPPCQPFSLAGQQKGVADDRHLAPVWLELVRTGRPPVIFGEQVAAAVKKDAWLDDLLDVLETEDYATGALVLPACGVGSPHIRQRIMFAAQRLADAERDRREMAIQQHGDGAAQTAIREADVARGDRPPRRLGHPINQGLEGHSGYGDHRDQSRRIEAFQAGSVAAAGGTGGMADHNEDGCEQQSPTRLHEEGQAWNDHDRCGESQRLAGSINGQLPQQGLAPETGDGSAAVVPKDRPADQGDGFWSDPDWLGCRDGKFRPVGPGTFPLADGISARVGRLRAYGNAIVPQVAAEVIRELM